jgi:hypothetical protein
MLKSNPQPTSSNKCAGVDLPCRGMATYILDLAKELLFEECASHNGKITTRQIEEIIGKLGEAPGELPKVYTSKYEKCAADFSLKFEKEWKLSEDFQSKLTEMVGKKGRKIVAGHLQTVGLDSLKSELGEKWAALAERVYETAEHCITNRLTSKDTFSRTQNNEFIICFGELSGEEALFKARAIEGDIAQKLLGKDGESKLEQFELDVKSLSKLAQINIPTHEIEIDPDEVSDGNICDGLLDRLEKAQQQMYSNRDAIMDSIVSHGKIRPRSVQKYSGEETHTTLLDWDETSRNRIAQIRAQAGNDSSVLANIDHMSLINGATLISEGKLPQGQILTIGVNFETLREKNSMRTYQDICTRFGNEVKSRIAINLILPPTRQIPHGVLEMCDMLRSFCVALAIQIHPFQIDGFHFENSGISLVILSYRYFLASARKQPEMLKAFARELNSKGFSLLVDRVPRNTDPELFHKHCINFLAFESVSSSAL